MVTCCGYEDPDDLDLLRVDPAFKLACGHLPDTGRDLTSQPTPSQFILCTNDTCNVADGYQQLSLFNTHYDARCFLPIHTCNTQKVRPVAVILRLGKTPDSVEVRTHLRRLLRHVRKSFRDTRILLRGDSHYTLPQAMTWCEDSSIEQVFGLSGTKRLSKKVDEIANVGRTECAVRNRDVVCDYVETRHRANSWDREPRAIAWIETTRRGLDIRFIGTNLAYGSPEWLYENLYCARGQTENLIKLDRTQL